MRARVFTAPLVVAVLVLAGHARAGTNAAAAQALFEEARTLMANGNFQAACAKLEGSEGLDPGAGTEYNLALCYEKSGRTASAWAMYLTAAAAYKATNRPDWEAKARERSAALGGALAKVTITLGPGAPADLQITRDGAKVTNSEIGTPIPLDPGHHVIEAVASGRPTWSSAFDIAQGTTRTVTITLGAPAPVAGDPLPPPSSSSSGSGLRTVGLILGGVGIAGLGVGTVTGLVAIGKNSSSKKACPDDGPCANADALRDNASASDWATVSTVGFIAGGVLVAAGAVLYLTAPSSSSTGRAFVVPTIGLGSAGIAGAW